MMDRQSADQRLIGSEVDRSSTPLGESWRDVVGWLADHDCDHVAVGDHDVTRVGDGLAVDLYRDGAVGAGEIVEAFPNQLGLSVVA